MVAVLGAGFSTEDEIDRVFHALADGTRRDILRRTAEREQSISALARHYAMSLPAVQKHVAVLERAGLVAKSRQGREQLLSGDPATIRKAADLLDAYEALWAGRIDRIAGLLGEEGTTS
jgi:DNA-binding transcriptional ArsR family regulator